MIFKGRTGSLSLLFLVFLLLSLATRCVLFLKALPNLDVAPVLLAKIFGVGLFFDCVTFSYVSLPFLLFMLVVPDKIFKWRPILWTTFFIFIYALLFNMVAEYVFFDEFGTRYNFIAIDYLVYTTEVVRNIWESYPLLWILAAILTGTVGIFLVLRKYVDQAREGSTTLGGRLKRWAVCLLLPILAWLFVDLSWSSVSRNNYANELAANGLYSLAAAFRNNELDYNHFYAVGDTKQIFARLRGMLQDDDEIFVRKSGADISRTILPEGREKRLNIIVVVEESLSAEFLGTFGNRLNLTPNLDRIARESLVFSNLYATGTRTVRGLEAITLSVPPLPGCSIIKRPHNENLFSWGKVMRDKGYDNKFVYGGHGYFDNMNYFFSHNGFNIVDKADFSDKEVTFENAWGVCDEDLFRKVVREADKSYSKHQPFFDIVMTTSNHRPFTYPSGKVFVPSGTGREGGVMYADYAIGKFIEQARKQPWFDRTVFVFVADHCAESARKYALPVDKYRIPLIVYSPLRIIPGKVDALASQIDVAPTVLGLLNFSYTSRFVGRDILDEDAGPRRAFISTYEKLGYLEDDKLLVLSPKKKISFFRCNFRDGETTELPLQQEYLQNALGYYQGENYLYQNRYAVEAVSVANHASPNRHRTAQKSSDANPA